MTNSFQIGPPRGVVRAGGCEESGGSSSRRRRSQARELTLNADTTPAFVLPAESNDELDDLIAEWGTSITSLGSPPFPLATRELPVPAKQSLGRDEKATPAPPWKNSAERSEDRSVCGSVANVAMELPLRAPGPRGEAPSARCPCPELSVGGIPVSQERGTRRDSRDGRP